MPIKRGKNKTIKVVTKQKKLTKNKSAEKVTKHTKQVINKDILMGELVSKYPQTSEVLMKHGLHCIGCMLSPYESLESGVAVHGIPIKPLIKELNQVINKPKIKTKNS